MKTLTVILKQHTPLIHFQHDQYGATLRASEVKPKLDRYILEKLGNDEYESGRQIAKEKGWLIGKGDHPALDYKMKIIVKPEDQVRDINLKVKQNHGRWTTDVFPLLLANMGGRDTAEELMNFSMYKSVLMILNCSDDGLFDLLKESVSHFFSNTNFGQRSNKGFGSFTVAHIKDASEEKGKNVNGHKYIKEGTLFMDFCIREDVKNDSLIYQLYNQKILFKVIERFWKELRDRVKKDGQVNCREINSVESYIKSMKEITDRDIERIPAPILFKPISYIDEDNLMFSIYIMLDGAMLQRLKMKYGDQTDITTRNSLMPNKINSMVYVDDFINKITDDDYNDYNWEISIERRKTINIVFYKV